MMDKTAYEIWKRRKPKLNYLHVFGSKCFKLSDREPLGKFDAQSDEGLFLKYSMNSHVFRVFNKQTGVMMESVNVTMEDVEHKKECSKNTTIKSIETLVFNTVMNTQQRTSQLQQQMVIKVMFKHL